jgi:hypothetical protein
MATVAEGRNPAKPIIANALVIVAIVAKSLRVLKVAAGTDDKKPASKSEEPPSVWAATGVAD